jgi:ribonuclease HII
MFGKAGIVAAGTDEAGRGPLAGPVVAAAVILTNEQRQYLLSKGLKDSKKLSPSRREDLFCRMCECDIKWRAQAASPYKIDRINILQASLWCMKRSVERLDCEPDIVLVDGCTYIPGLGIYQRCVVKGDDRVPAIAAASVVAKVLRDRIMRTMDKIYPDYGFSAHKGYPSAEHRRILLEIGPSPIHRVSFRGVSREPAE